MSIKNTLEAEVITGKDYLRMAKAENQASALFKDKLTKALTAGNIIYVISEPEHVRLLPEDPIRVPVSADPDTIKERFRKRMHGNLPAPMAAIREKKHGMFDDGALDYRSLGVTGDVSALCRELLSR